MKKQNIFCALILLTVLSVPAQEQKPGSYIAFDAFADAYYTSVSGVMPGDTVPLLYNYNVNNAVAVNYARFKTQFATGKDKHAGSLRGNLGFHAGSYVDANYSGENGSTKHLSDANAGVMLHDDIWLEAGIFSSHIGIESAISTDSPTLTRALASEYSPYYETGARICVERYEKIKFCLMVLNGWQNITENNRNKAVGTQLIWTPSEKFTLNSSGFFGEARNRPDAQQTMRFFHDLYLHWNIIPDKLRISGLADYGLEESAPFSGVYNDWLVSALLVRYRPKAKWAFCLRGEWLDDPSNKLGLSNGKEGPAIWSASFNTDWIINDELLLRGEIRNYHSTLKQFATNENNQVAGTFGIAYHFNHKINTYKRRPTPFF